MCMPGLKVLNDAPVEAEERASAVRTLRPLWRSRELIAAAGPRSTGLVAPAHTSSNSHAEKTVGKAGGALRGKPRSVSDVDNLGASGLVGSAAHEGNPYADIREAAFKRRQSMEVFDEVPTVCLSFGKFLFFSFLFII